MPQQDIGQNSLLFLDDHDLEQAWDTVRTFHQCEKEVGNPVLTKKLAWEGIGPYSPCAEPHPDGGYNLFYGTYGGKNSDYPSGYMYSADGINWTRRSEWLNTIDDGAQACVTRYDAGCNFGEWRYLGMAFFRSAPGISEPHIRFRRSRDGINWEPFPGNPYWIGPSDVYSFMWDPNRNKYVLYYKLWKLAGETLAGESFVSYFPGFDPEEGKDTFRAQGYAVLPERRPVDVTLKYAGSSANDGGGGYVSSSITMIRIVARAESVDFVHWDHEQVIIEPPEDAPLGDQSYGLFVRMYQGLYLGWLSHFNGVSGLIRPLLAWSRDGVHFSVNYDQYLLDSEKGNWDGGMIAGSELLTDIDRRLCLYYGGIDIDHTMSDREMTAGIGRAWLRRDGFVSLSGGEITTRPFRITRNRLALNMSGRIRVTVLDKDGAVLHQTVASGDHERIIPDLELDAYGGLYLRFRLDLREGALYALRLTGEACC